MREAHFLFYKTELSCRTGLRLPRGPPGRACGGRRRQARLLRSPDPYPVTAGAAGWRHRGVASSPRPRTPGAEPPRSPAGLFRRGPLRCPGRPAASWATAASPRHGERPGRRHLPRRSPPPDLAPLGGAQAHNSDKRVLQAPHPPAGPRAPGASHVRTKDTALARDGSVCVDPTT